MYILIYVHIIYKLVVMLKSYWKALFLKKCYITKIGLRKEIQVDQ